MKARLIAQAIDASLAIGGDVATIDLIDVAHAGCQVGAVISELWQECEATSTSGRWQYFDGRTVDGDEWRVRVQTE